MPRTQRNRIRLEQTDFLLIRQPIFSRYEQVILSHSVWRYFGLTGPQGFGKSAFLHYFATKYCNHPSYIVIYVPWCPDNTKTLKEELAKAFYRGCRIAGLGNYKELTRIDSIDDMIKRCRDFAASNGRQILVVIDQMKTQPPGFFNSTVNDLRRATDITVILSSSMSHQVSSVFGNEYHTLDRYSYRTTPDEAILLSSRPPTT